MNTTKGFKRILLATDGSEQAEAAVDATIALGLFAAIGGEENPLEALCGVHDDSVPPTGQRP